MNFTIGKAKVNTWKSVKAQYIAAACGLALAMGAVSGLGAWRDGGAAAPSVPARASISVPQSEQAPREFVIFIAGSQQQASDYAAQLYQDLNRAWFALYSFVVVANAEEEAWLHYANAQAAREDLGVSLEVVDLRNR